MKKWRKNYPALRAKGFHKLLLEHKGEQLPSWYQRALFVVDKPNITQHHPPSPIIAFCLVIPNSFKWLHKKHNSIIYNKLVDITKAAARLCVLAITCVTLLREALDNFFVKSSEISGKFCWNFAKFCKILQKKSGKIRKFTRKKL